jgi:tRNA G46 methylase TrmB
LPLFEFALEQAEEFTKFEIVNEIRDLHSKRENVIMTEYEKRFTEMGNPIYYVEFKKAVK